MIMLSFMTRKARTLLQCSKYITDSFTTGKIGCDQLLTLNKWQ